MIYLTQFICGEIVEILTVMWVYRKVVWYLHRNKENVLQKLKDVGTFLCVIFVYPCLSNILRIYKYKKTASLIHNSTENSFDSFFLFLS